MHISFTPNICITFIFTQLEYILQNRISLRKPLSSYVFEGEMKPKKKEEKKIKHTQSWNEAWPK